MEEVDIKVSEEEAISIFNQYLLDKMTFIQTKEYHECNDNKICEMENLAKCGCFANFRNEMLELKERALLERDIEEERSKIL